jgi:hypothetical protein
MGELIGDMVSVWLSFGVKCIGDLCCSLWFGTHNMRSPSDQESPKFMSVSRARSASQKQINSFFDIITCCGCAAQKMDTEDISQPVSIH